MERDFPKMVKLTLTPTNLFSGGKMSIETVLMDFHVVPCLDELVYVRYDKAGGSTIVSKSLMMLLRDVATVATCVAEALRQDCLEQVHASCMGQNILLLKSFIPHQYFFTLYVFNLSPYPLFSHQGCISSAFSYSAIYSGPKDCMFTIKHYFRDHNYYF